MKKALISGITGQDGSYLAEFLLSKGYEVHGIKRRASSFNTQRLDSIYKDPHAPDARLKLHYGDMADGSSLANIIQMIEPDEIYNLASQSHVQVSFDIPEYTADIAALGTLRILDAIRHTKRPIRFYQASSSEMFGNAPSPQNELTPFRPLSPYACAKVFAHNITANYREAYGLFACSGILFNHESERRGETFVSRKISRSVARIKKGLDKYLYLGYLGARRDWGYAPEYVEAMWLMLQQTHPVDYVIATGEIHTVEEFVEEAFSYAGLHWVDHVRFDDRYVRPSEVFHLIGDASKAKRDLGWKPKVKFKELVRKMVDHDLLLVVLMLLAFSGCATQRTLCEDLEPVTCDQVRVSLQRANGSMEPVFKPPVTK